MAITSGFFNSVAGDRVYDADDISNMFKGLITDGIYANVGDGFVVEAGSGLTLNIGTGRAIVQDRWIENDTTATITLNSAHVTLNRYTAIVLRKSTTNRSVTLEMIDGTNASAPVKPTITRNVTTYDILLAYVYVPAGATAITGSQITDMRADTTVCGFVTGLITQVDTSTLFNQYSAAYQENLADMEDWEQEQKDAFDAWYAALTQDLNVDTYVEKHDATIVVTTANTSEFSLPFSAAQFASGDILEVYANGIRLAPDAYTVDYGTRKVTTAAQYGIGQVFYFVAMKSVIGVAT